MVVRAGKPLFSDWSMEPDIAVKIGIESKVAPTRVGTDWVSRSKANILRANSPAITVNGASERALTNSERQVVTRKP